MTFDEIIKIDPRLGELRKDIINRMERIPKRKWGARDRAWYKEFKPRMYYLVGFGASKAELQTCEAYDTAYHTFIEIIDGRKT